MERYRVRRLQGQKAGDRFVRLEKITLWNKIMERLRPNQLNHQNNLKLHTGYYHGLYRREGVPRPNAKKLEAKWQRKLPSKGTIFKWVKR